MDKKSQKYRQATKAAVIVVSMAVYAGAIIYADLMFLQIMRTTFATGVLGALAMAGAVMVGVSAIILPLALHFWFKPGAQKMWGFGFYFVDILILALNSILAYQLAQDGGLDSFFAVWALLSPASPVIAIVGWGVAFILDPSNAFHEAIEETKDGARQVYLDEFEAAAKSDESLQTVRAGAKLFASDVVKDIVGTHAEITTSVDGHEAEEVVIKSKK